MNQAMELLIDRVRRQPCLWDMNDLSYRNVSKKDWIWERVAKEAGMSNGNEAKSTWKKLRDRHREALRRRTKSITDSKMKPWKHEASMSFLLQTAEENEHENVTLFSHDSNNEEDLEEQPIETIYETIDSSSPSPVPFAEPEVKFYTPEVKRAKRHLKDEIRSPPSTSQDSLSTLFESLHQKIRKLPTHLQLRVQREIFESVLRAEEEALNDPLGAHASPCSSTSKH